MRAYRVFGVNYDGRSRRIVAAKTLKEASRLLNLPYSRFKTYGCQTHNDVETALALLNPGDVYECGYRPGAQWKKVEL